MYPDPTALAQARMADLRREADEFRRAQRAERVRAPKTEVATSKTRARLLHPSMWLPARFHHA